MPPPAADKVIISNRKALTAKYTAAGVAQIDAALQAVISADKTRGHATIIVEIDDQAQMTPFGGTAVVAAGDDRGAKEAVDKIDAAISPDFILLLDGPDVIPHVKLDPIAGIDGDPDKNVPSDLPYASPAAFSRKASAYLAATRVVGRLPVPPGVTNAAQLVALLGRSAAHQPLQRSQFKSYFATSAEVWQVSTQQSLRAVFGGHAALHLAPKATHTAIDQSLQHRVHFINCHGAISEPQFYGEKDGKLPVAMESAKLAPHVRPGTIAAAECCYGAELYDPQLAGAAQPICMSYLDGGAIAFVGSTNVAYGPAAGQGQADLITQDFLIDALGGASIGRAFLQARQRFVRTQVMSTPVNLKTLAQFVLYGDPSLMAVPRPSPVAPDAAGAADASPTAKDYASARKARRIGLKSDGEAFASASTFPGKKLAAKSAVVTRVAAIAKAEGFKAMVELYAVDGGADFAAAAKAKAKAGAKSPKVAVVCETLPQRTDTKSGAKLPYIRVLIAHILGDGIISVEECESR